MTGFDVLVRLVLYLCCVSCTGVALFEDQIGFFDWNQKYIGKVQFVAEWRDHPKSTVFLGSAQNVIASVFLRNGSSVWRQVQGDHMQLTNLVLCGRNIISASSNGSSVLRSWDSNSGSIFWEYPVDLSLRRSSVWCDSDIDFLLYTTGNTLESLRIQNGRLLASISLTETAFHQDARILSTPLAHNDTHLHVVVLTFSQPKHSGGTLAGTVSVVSIQKRQPLHSTVLHFQEFSAPWVTPDWDSSSCLLLANADLFLVCLSSHVSNASGVLHLLNLGPSAGESDWTNIELHQRTPKILQLTGTSFIITSPSGSGGVFELGSTGKLRTKYRLNEAMFAHLVSLNGRDYLFTGSHNAEQPFKNFNLTVYDANTGELCAELPRRQWTIAKHHGEVESIRAMMFTDSAGALSFRLLVQTEDHAIQLVRQNGQQQWLRDESLADIVAVEMVDLPVSESQAKMEEEFGHSTSNIFEMFAKRLHTQLAQLWVFIRDCAAGFPQTISAFIRSPSSFMSSFSDRRGLPTRSSQPVYEDAALPVATMPPRLRHPLIMANETVDGLDPAESPPIRSMMSAFLTRDNFNLHKMIVVATAVGKLFGLESEKGRVVWEHLVPSAVLLANGKLTLYQQRNTAHFPLPPITTLLLRSKKTNLPMLYSFNPSTGVPLEKFPNDVFHLDSDVIQAVMFPGPVTERTDYIRPILLLDKESQVHIYPSRYATALVGVRTPVYMYTIEHDLARLTGYRIHLSSAVASPRQPGREDSVLFKATRAWRMQLRSTLPPDGNGDQNPYPPHVIVAAASRPNGEHIHSVGRVLGDRSVLYKYLNPNLIAVVTAGGSVASQTNSIAVYLIDVVVGRIVYSAINGRCSEPVNLVHSENWIVYTYYNHQSLRHEVTVLELYEPTNYSPAGYEVCASYSVPGPAQLFLRNIFPTGWLPSFAHSPSNARQTNPVADVGDGADEHVTENRPPSLVDSGGSIFSSLFRATDSDGICNTTGANSLIPQVVQQSYIFSTAPTPGVAAVSLTERGITSKSIIFGLQKGSLIELPKTFFDPRRALDLSPELMEEGVLPYTPVLPLSDQAVISYNQTIMGVRAIRTAATGLESTSLVFAYGLDLFCTRISPSLTYDLLKEDFDYTAIATVTLGMIVASIATQRLAARRAVYRAWA
ncbi:hypothetical protein CRM22_006038 [Opisthorchis felineus]|uniref:ER membrane protein complex subunit 1 n=1 Tax=Opisthorchis felineus TaxID=147828 RepID=A0A4S2LV27_OPIFE|nr:hypothetical protein CRM22_006038 [Opisthorchis felineus]